MLMEMICIYSWIPHSMWRGIQIITDFRPTAPFFVNNATLPDVLNAFYAQLDVQNNVTATKFTPPPDKPVICQYTTDMRGDLSRVNTHIAAGPDNIPGWGLKNCPD